MLHVSGVPQLQSVRSFIMLIVYAKLALMSMEMDLEIGILGLTLTVILTAVETI